MAEEIIPFVILLWTIAGTVSLWIFRKLVLRMVGSRRSRGQGVLAAVLAACILAPGIAVGHGFLIGPASLLCLISAELLSNGQDQNGANLIVNGLSLVFTFGIFMFVESESREDAA